MRPRLQYERAARERLSALESADSIIDRTYREILDEYKAPANKRYEITKQTATRRSQRAGRTNMVKAALKKLFPMEMHLAEKRRIG